MYRIFKYAHAIIRWVWYGREFRSQESIDEIYNNVCKPCENFSDEYSMCELCWCNLNTNRDTGNKIALYTEECEIGKWEEEDDRAEERDAETEDKEEAQGEG